MRKTAARLIAGILCLCLWASALPALGAQGLLLTGDPVLSASGRGTISLELHSKLPSEALNVEITGITSDHLTLVPKDASGVYPLSNLASGQSLAFELPVVLDKGVAGAQSALVHVRYKLWVLEGTTPTLKTYTETLPFIVNCDFEPEAPDSITLDALEWSVSPSSLRAGEKATLTVRLAHSKLTELSASLSGAALSLGGLTTSAAVQTAKPGQAGETILTFPIEATKDALSGEKHFTLHVDAKNADQTTTIALRGVINFTRIEGDVKNGEVLIASIRSGAQAGTQGDPRTLEVTLKNTTQKDVKLRLSLGGLSSETLSLIGSETPALTVPAGKSISHTFRLYINPGLISGNYPVTVSASGDDLTLSQTVFVLVKNTIAPTPAPTGQAITHVMVSGVSIESQNGGIQAGQPFTLTLTFKNNGKKAVKDLRLTIASDQNRFIPVDGSTTHFIPALASGAETTLTLQMTAAKDAAVGMHTVTASMDYVDSAGEIYKGRTNSIGLRVTPALRLDVSDISFFAFAAGEPTMLSGMVANKGKSALYNVTVRLEGPIEAHEPVRIGSIAAGATQNFDASFIPTQIGEGEVTAVFDFADDQGNPGQTRVVVSGGGSSELPGEPGITPIFPGGPDIGVLPIPGGGDIGVMPLPGGVDIDPVMPGDGNIDIDPLPGDKTPDGELPGDGEGPNPDDKPASGDAEPTGRTGLLIALGASIVAIIIGSILVSKKAGGRKKA